MHDQRVPLFGSVVDDLEDPVIWVFLVVLFIIPALGLRGLESIYHAAKIVLVIGAFLGLAAWGLVHRVERTAKVQPQQTHSPGQRTPIVR